MDLAIEWNVWWNPSCNQEISAKSRFLCWKTLGRHKTLLAGRNKGHDCVFIWPINNSTKGRWIRSNQITQIF